MSGLSFSAGAGLLPGNTTSLAIPQRAKSHGATVAASKHLAAIIRLNSEYANVSGSFRRAADRLLEKTNSESLTLSAAFQELAESEQQILKKSLGKRWEEMACLANEKDARVFHAGLYALGRRSLEDDNMALAGAVFQFLAESGNTVPAEVQEKAKRDFNAMNGRGPLGSRIAMQFPQFLEQGMEPGMLAGMGVASVVASGLKLGFLARLAGKPASFWTRGTMAGLSASAVAFPAEVAAFWGTTRAVGMALHPETLKWDAGSIAGEFESLAMGLFFLKAGSALTGKLFDKVHGFDPITQDLARLPAFARFTRPLATQLGMVTGIATSHFIEGKAEPRPHAGNFWTEVLSTWLNFNIAGHLSQRFMGPGHAQLMQEMAFRTRAIESGSPGDGWLGSFQSLLSFVPSQEFATPEGFVLPEKLISAPALMSSMDPAGKGKGGGSKSTTGLSIDSIETVPNPGSFDSTIESLLLEFGRGANKPKLARELYPYKEAVRRVHERMVQIEVNAGKKIAPAIAAEALEAILNKINRYHFEGVSDQMRKWYDKFNYLRGELGREVNKGTRRQRRKVRELLDSVELKWLETRRYVQDAESWLGDDKGPGPDSFFSETNYSPLLERFTDIDGRLNDYVHERKPLGRSLQQYRHRPALRITTSIVPQELTPYAKNLNLVPEHERVLLQALEAGDAFLGESNLYSLAQVFREMGHIKPPDPYRKFWRPLAQYTSILHEANKFISLKEVAKISRKITHFENWKKQIPVEPRSELVVALAEGGAPAPERLADQYLNAAKALADFFIPYQASRRIGMELKWPEVRQQLLRLKETGVLKPQTVAGLLEWFAPPHGSAGKTNTSLVGVRVEAVAGLVDFIRKGSLSVETRKELAGFIDEVVRRRDEQMMEGLAIKFNFYQTGNMRDRLQVKKRPSSDDLTNELAIETYDRFLVALQRTAGFYLKYPEVRGGFFELFYKLEYGPKNNNARLGIPVLHVAEDLLKRGHSVSLLRRGGKGEAILSSEHPKNGSRPVAVTSILEPVEVRQDLEVWLNRAVWEMKHQGSLPDGAVSEKKPARGIISITVPKIDEGITPGILMDWARDFLEINESIKEVQLRLPRTGHSVPDPFDPQFYEVHRVRPGQEPLMIALIENAKSEVKTHPRNLEARLELYNLRVNWATYLRSNIRLIRPEVEPEIRPDKTDHARNSMEKLQEDLRVLEAENWDLLKETFTLFPKNPTFLSVLLPVLENKCCMLVATGDHYLIGEASSLPAKKYTKPNGGELSVQHLPKLNPRLDHPARFKVFSDMFEFVSGMPLSMSASGYLLSPTLTDAKLQNVYWKSDGKKLVVEGEIAPVEESPEAPPSSSRINVAKVGTFSLRIEEERFRTGKGEKREEVSQPVIYFDNLFLPDNLRHRGLMAQFFKAIVQFGVEIGARKIVTERVSGDHRYVLALFGMKVVNKQELKNIRKDFEQFLRHLRLIPGWGDFDISALGQIQSPRDIALAHFNPHTQKLHLNRFMPGSSEAGEIGELPAHFQVGQSFLLKGSPSYRGEFDLDPDSYSFGTFNAYLLHRLNTRILFPVRVSN